jgi:serine/threonine-protein kinase
MAPEVAEGKGATCQSDIYSLGITFFELLTGKLPFNDANAVNIAMKQIGEQLPSVRKYRTDVDRRIEKVINKACSKEIKNRYASMRELKKDLQNAMCVEDKKENFLSKLIKKVKKDA